MILISYPSSIVITRDYCNSYMTVVGVLPSAGFAVDGLASPASLSSLPLAVTARSGIANINCCLVKLYILRWKSLMCYSQIK